MLAHRLSGVCADEAVVLGITRGGVPVAREVSRLLAIPMDVLVARRVTPADRRLTLGAVAESGEPLLRHAIHRFGPDQLAEFVRCAEAHVSREVAVYRMRHAPVPLVDRTAILVDDGVVTSATARVACRLARSRGARRVVFAAPVIPADAVVVLSDLADELPRAVTPPRATAVRDWYVDFPAVTEADVLGLLGPADEPATAGR